MKKRLDLRSYLMEAAADGGIPPLREVGRRFGVSGQRVHQVLADIESELQVTLKRLPQGPVFERRTISVPHSRPPEYVARYQERRQRLLAEFASERLIGDACALVGISPGSCSHEASVLERHGLLVCTKPNRRRRLCHAPDPQAPAPALPGGRTYVAKVRVTPKSPARASASSRRWAAMDPEEKRRRMAALHAARRKKA